MKKIILFFITITILFGISGCIKEKSKGDEENKGDITENNEMRIVNIYVENNSLEMKLSDNASAKEFYQTLQENDIIVTMNDYGDFEKVGALDFTITTCDKRIITSPGDVILYLGNSITIYYDINTWNFTLLGKIDNMTRDKMLSFLGGKGEVSVRFSLK